MIVGNKWLLAVSLLAVAVIGASFLLYRRKVTLSSVLRFLAAACIVASFGGLKLEIVRSVPLAIYALDVSESYASQRLSALEAIRTHAADLEPHSRAVLVTFSSSAAREGPIDIGKFSASPDAGAGLGRDATDMEACLRAVAATKGLSDRVYLFSDGRANRGNTGLGTLLCSQAKLRVLPVVLNIPVPADAWIAKLTAPSAVHPGQMVRIGVTAGASRESRLNLILTVGREQLAREIVVSAPGSEQRVEFTVSFEKPGIESLNAQVVTSEFADAFPANNSTRGAIRVLGPPRVLVATGRERTVIADLLGREERFSVEDIEPEKLPRTAGGLQDTAAVVLDNVPAVRLSPEQMTVLKRYVRDLGGGLIVAGGPDAFGRGGYIETELEEALPVWCNPEERKKASLVFVLDASGSMDRRTNFLGENMKKFKAALKAIAPIHRELREGDEVAIITFNTEPTLELPLTADADGRALKAAMTGELWEKVPAGKTNMYPALKGALEILKSRSSREPAERNLHIVLLSDGRQTVQDSMDLKQFVEAGISVSAVATGTLPDRERLMELAQITGGDYYEVAKFDSYLLRVFREDIRRNLSKLSREGEIKVTVSGQADFLRGIEGLPGLQGMALTSAKEGAEVAAVTGKNEPVLAWWRLGLGRAVVFTGALDDNWGREWLEWDNLRKLFSQVVRWSGRARTSQGFGLEVKVSGHTVRATVTAQEEGRFLDGLDLRAIFSCQGEKPVAISFEQTGPGEYEAHSQVKPESLCVVAVYREGGEIVTSAEVWVPGSLELGAQGPDAEALSHLALLTGGSVLTEEDFLSDTPGGKGGRSYDLWWVMLILAGCFFVVDIALLSLLSSRRLG